MGLTERLITLEHSRTSRTVRRDIAIVTMLMGITGLIYYWFVVDGVEMYVLGPLTVGLLAMSALGYIGLKCTPMPPDGLREYLRQLQEPEHAGPIIEALDISHDGIGFFAADWLSTYLPLLNSDQISQFTAAQRAILRSALLGDNLRLAVACLPIVEALGSLEDFWAIGALTRRKLVFREQEPIQVAARAAYERLNVRLASEQDRSVLLRAGDGTSASGLLLRSGSIHAADPPEQLLRSPDGV